MPNKKDDNSNFNMPYCYEIIVLYCYAVLAHMAIIGRARQSFAVVKVVRDDLLVVLKL